MSTFRLTAVQQMDAWPRRLMRGWAPKQVQKYGTSAGQMDVE